MKKKTYEQPKMKVVEIDQADIICTSDPQGQINPLYDDNSYDDSLF